MFAEFGKVFTVALAGQFGWLAVGLALIPPFIVLATQWFWKDSDGLPSVSARFANLKKICREWYLTKCSDTLQKFVGDPITSSGKFLRRSSILYSILFLFAYYMIEIYNNELDISLKFPSKFDDFFELSMSFCLGYFIFIFCVSQSVLFLDLCKSSRSSWQVFFALIADVLLTFAAVAIFAGAIQALETWHLYSTEKRQVSLEWVPIGQMASERQSEFKETLERDVISWLQAMDETDFSKRAPIVFAGVVQRKSNELQKKERMEFETFYSFKGGQKPSNIFVIGYRAKFDNSLEISLSQALDRMVSQQDPCSPLLVQVSSKEGVPLNQTTSTIFVSANLTPNMKALAFGKTFGSAIVYQLQLKWQTIGSGFMHSDRNIVVPDLRNATISSDDCAHYSRKAKPLDQYRDGIFIEAYYNELNSKRSPFWYFGIPSSYYAFACFTTSLALIFVMIGLFLVNIYNLSVDFSNIIFSKSIFIGISAERRAIANSVILGITIFVSVALLRIFFQFAFS